MDEDILSMNDFAASTDATSRDRNGSSLFVIPKPPKPRNSKSMKRLSINQDYDNENENDNNVYENSKSKSNLDEDSMNSSFMRLDRAPNDNKETKQNLRRSSQLQLESESEREKEKRKENDKEKESERNEADSDSDCESDSENKEKFETNVKMITSKEDILSIGAPPQSIRNKKTELKIKRAKTLINGDLGLDNLDLDFDFITNGDKNNANNNNNNNNEYNENDKKILVYYTQRPPNLPVEYGIDDEFVCLNCNLEREWKDGVWRSPMWPSFDICDICANTILSKTSKAQKQAIMETDNDNDDNDNDNDNDNENDNNNENKDENDNNDAIEKKEEKTDDMTSNSDEKEDRNEEMKSAPSVTVFDNILQIDNQSDKELIDEMKLQIDKLNNELTNVQDANKNIVEKLETMETKMSEMENEKNEIAQLSSTNLRLKEDLQNENQDLKHQLSQLKMLLDEKNAKHLTSVNEYEAKIKQLNDQLTQALQENSDNEHENDGNRSTRDASTRDHAAEDKMGSSSCSFFGRRFC